MRTSNRDGIIKIAYLLLISCVVGAFAFSSGSTPNDPDLITERCLSNWNSLGPPFRPDAKSAVYAEPIYEDGYASCALIFDEQSNMRCTSFWGEIDRGFFDRMTLCQAPDASVAGLRVLRVQTDGGLVETSR